MSSSYGDEDEPMYESDEDDSFYGSDDGFGGYDDEAASPVAAQRKVDG